MRKTRVLGFALTLAATMVVGSAMGQVAGGTNFVKVGATDGDASNHRSFITKGKTLGFYAQPDASFHPAYSAPGWTLTSGFVWNWTAPASVATNKPATSPANYVELTPSAIGTYSITVKEKSSAAFGGCEDATGKTFDLVVFDLPTIDFVTDTPNSIGGRPLTEPCGNIAAWTVKMNLSATDFVTAKYKLEVFSVTVNAAGTPVVAATATSTVTYNTAKLAAGTDYSYSASDKWSLSGTAFDYDAGNANRSLDLTQSRAFNVGTGDVITLYRYSIDGGVSDFVTRKSDNGGTESFYTGTAATQVVDIYVKRAPVTGPVYHINNNVAK